MRCLVLAVSLMGCTDTSVADADDTDVVPTTGDALLTFTVTNGVKASPNLVDPLVGRVHGNLFLTPDVTLSGPIDGAEEFGAMELDVDLSVDEVSVATFTTDQLGPATYTWLGFFDLDDNGANGEPEDGDPVTLPTTNQFEIMVGETIEWTVIFDLVL